MKKQILFMLIFLLLSGCSSTEIPVLIQESEVLLNDLTVIETGYIPSLFNPRVNDYHFEEDGLLHIDIYHEDWSYDVHLINPATLEIDYFAEHREASSAEGAFARFHTKEFTIYQRNDSEASLTEYYFVNDDETKLLFSSDWISDSENSLLYHPYYDKYNGKIYLANKEDEQCVIYEVQNTGDLKELNRIETNQNNLALTDFDARTMTWIYSGNTFREIHSGKHIYKINSNDIYEIIGDYLLIIPYRVDEDTRIIHLKNHKERTLDKSVLPYQNNQRPDWHAEGNQISFVEYSIPHKQFIHAIYDGKTMKVNLLGFDKDERLIQLNTTTALYIVNETETDHLYWISLQ
ncbi:MAG: hypothetical protein IJC38_01570 [Erysipelotrichaceae bacterium]|nr:hypothetical protein [Erysipelotrichaceae bacterium]